MADETHYSLEDLQRVFAGRSTGSHEERVAAHLLGCRPCRLLAARVIEPLMRSGNLRLDGPLRWAADLQHMEQTRLTEGLDVRASWAEIRTLSWKARREKVRLTRRLHSEKFLDLLLAEGSAAAPAEAEEIFQLALLTAGSLPLPEHSAEEQNDRRAQCYAEVGNARRLQAKWGAADDALQRGAEHAAKGTGTGAAEARVLCIMACLADDLGNADEAAKLLRRAATLFEAAGETLQAGKALAKLAHTFAELKPKEGLQAAAKALALLPPGQPRLVLQTEGIRVNCLLNSGAHLEALARFADLNDLFQQFREPAIRLARSFTAARILEHLGWPRQAEILFEDVLAGYLEHAWRRISS